MELISQTEALNGRTLLEYVHRVANGFSGSGALSLPVSREIARALVHLLRARALEQKEKEKEED